MADIVKIYLPTPTRKGGIVEVNARPSQCNEGAYERADGGWQRFWPSNADDGWFLDKDKALAAAEAGRIKRIASLKKQLAKLETIGPFVVVEG